MARSHAKLFASIWTDPDWLQLDQGAQHLYMLLLSQPKLTLVGVLDMMPSRWAAMTHGTDTATICEELDRLEAARFIITDRATGELLIRTFARHDVQVAARNRNLRAGYWRAWRTIQSLILRRAAWDETPRELREDDSAPSKSELPELTVPTGSSNQQSELTVPPVDNTTNPQVTPVGTTSSNYQSEQPVATSLHPPPSYDSSPHKTHGPSSTTPVNNPDPPRGDLHRIRNYTPDTGTPNPELNRTGLAAARNATRKEAE